MSKLRSWYLNVHNLSMRKGMPLQPYPRSGAENHQSTISLPSICKLRLTRYASFTHANTIDLLWLFDFSNAQAKLSICHVPCSPEILLDLFEPLVKVLPTNHHLAKVRLKMVFAYMFRTISLTVFSSAQS